MPLISCTDTPRVPRPVSVEILESGSQSSIIAGTLFRRRVNPDPLESRRREDRSFYVIENVFLKIFYALSCPRWSALYHRKLLIRQYSTPKGETRTNPQGKPSHVAPSPFLFLLQHRSSPLNKLSSSRAETARLDLSIRSIPRPNSFGRFTSELRSSFREISSVCRDDV